MAPADGGRIRCTITVPLLYRARGKERASGRTAHVAQRSKRWDTRPLTPLHYATAALMEPVMALNAAARAPILEP